MYEYDYSYSTGDTELVAGILGLFGVLWLVIAAVCIFLIVCQWRIFTKAGQPGWKALIPFYSGWVFNQIIFGPQFGWLMFAYFVGVIPVVGSLAMIAWTVYTYVKLANAYGKSGGFGAFMVFFPVIGLPMLAFGSSQYCGPQAPFFAKNQQAGGWDQSGTGTGAWGQQNQWGQQNAWGQQQNAWGQQPQQNAWGQQPQANQWGQAPAQQPQQNTWGQTPAQQPQQDAWGQAPVQQPQQDAWGQMPAQQPQSGWTGQAPAQNPWADTQNADPNQQDNSNPFV